MPRLRSRPPRTFTIPAEDLDLVWVSDYYDQPLTGLCRVDGRWCAFDWGYRQPTVAVTELRPWSRWRWWARKRLFERCVGYHWSYGPQHRAFDPGTTSTLLFKLYYARQKWPRWRENTAWRIVALWSGKTSFADFLKNLWRNG